MECVLGKENCFCTKCLACGLCTRGSQYHRSCMFEYEGGDHEVRELLAGDEECLPTIEQEIEAEQVRSNTPLSAAEEFVESLDYQTHTIEMVQVSGDVVRKAVRKSSAERFTGRSLWVHKYVSGEVTWTEFKIMREFYGTAFRLFYHKGPVRMHTAVQYYDQRLYHQFCNLNPYRRPGVLTVKARDAEDLSDLMRENPKHFFCGLCKRFLFTEVLYESDSHWKDLTYGGTWPECKKNAWAVGILDRPDESYSTLKVDLVVAIIRPFLVRGVKRRIEEVDE